MTDHPQMTEKVTQRKVGKILSHILWYFPPLCIYAMKIIGTAVFHRSQDRATESRKTHKRYSAHRLQKRKTERQADEMYAEFLDNTKNHSFNSCAGLWFWALWPDSPKGQTPKPAYRFKLYISVGTTCRIHSICCTHFILRLSKYIFAPLWGQTQFIISVCDVYCQLLVYVIAQ